ncbi:ParB/RepB/Spo0J family partition protein [Anaeroarcus burkinensis]|uniref:ParB/RepB/Spo0J family partition protein n=1 Tax=Anaeroarcus burkinensis TaxID=82376 RepID=UPI00040A5F4B|nr:ParB/RepB/Spo0J family partition protein [Anaeroarcus burkinensis]
MNPLTKLFGFGQTKEEINEENSKEAPAAVEASIETEAAAEAEPKQQEVRSVLIETIQANRFQPRKTFHDESLEELAASIREFGVLQPLLVRPLEEGFELVAGERRLRASKLAGLTEVPVIAREIDDKEMAEMAMIENLQREDLHFLEEAEGFQLLIVQFGFTQEELAKRVGKSQSTLANKLRLLKLTPQVRKRLQEERLSERHARALLKLESPEEQEAVLAVVCAEQLNVRQTEDLIVCRQQLPVEEEGNGKSKKKERKRLTGVIRDVRIFLNTIQQVADTMKKNGLAVQMQQRQEDDDIIVELRIPKKKAAGK